jgi:hypothetical protein
MRFLPQVLAELPLLPWRLLRTRLGLWLGLLMAGLWWLEHGDPAADPVGIAVLAGTLGAVICVAALAGSAADRAALAHRLLHPTTPLAIAIGRWLAAVCGASLLVAIVVGQAAWTTRVGLTYAGAAAAGLAAAAAVSAAVLALVWIGGNALAVLAFAWLFLVSALPPEALIGLWHGGVLALIGAGILEIGPSIWRYRSIAIGDMDGAAHAVVWIAVGLGIATWRATRLGARRL